MPTKSQRTAQAAYARVAAHTPLSAEYRSFAREFPTLVHTCGLAQAVAFARAKGGQQEAYANDLATVLTAAGYADSADAAGLAQLTREKPVMVYVRLSRDALAAAVWLKRYVEALAEDSGRTPTTPQTQGG